MQFAKIKLNRLGFILVSIILVLSACGSENKHLVNGLKDSNNYYINLSSSLVIATKKNKETHELLDKLAKISIDSLAFYLNTNNQKKAFWINIYNANIQIHLKKEPNLYLKRSNFFGENRITIANQSLSFDDIEHGILRGGKYKWALGYVSNPFPEKFEKKFKVNETDNRIHFALNCGAISCPPVAVYTGTNIEQKIDTVAMSFLKASSIYNESSQKVEVTSLFSWFRGDFNGKDGVIQILKKYNVIPFNSNPDISYNPYNWELSLGNYYEEN
jgi:hypothetical protein